MYTIAGGHQRGFLWYFSGFSLHFLFILFKFSLKIALILLIINMKTIRKNFAGDKSRMVYITRIMEVLL